MEAAAACYRQAISISPRDINALCNLGMIFLQQKSYREAEHYLTQAIQTDNSSAKGFNFNKALKLNPDAESFIANCVTRMFSSGKPMPPRM